MQNAECSSNAYRSQRQQEREVLKNAVQVIRKADKEHKSRPRLKAVWCLVLAAIIKTIFLPR